MPGSRAGVLLSGADAHNVVGSGASHPPAPECLAVERLDTPRLRVRQQAEFLPSGALGEIPLILGEKAEQQIDQALGHIEKGLDLPAEAVIALQERLLSAAARMRA